MSKLPAPLDAALPLCLFFGLGAFLLRAAVVQFWYPLVTPWRAMALVDRPRAKIDVERRPPSTARIAAVTSSDPDLRVIAVIAGRRSSPPSSRPVIQRAATRLKSGVGEDPSAPARPSRSMSARHASGVRTTV